MDGTRTVAAVGARVSGRADTGAIETVSAERGVAAVAWAAYRSR